MYNEEAHFVVEEESTTYDDGRDFTSLKAWQEARKVKLFFYRSILPLLPKKERYQLAGQIRDASVSTTANIAEGYGRYHYQEGIQFYRISRGSLYELKDHLITCKDLDYIEEKFYKEGLPLIEKAKKILNGYIKFVKKAKGKFLDAHLISPYLLPYTSYLIPLYLIPYTQITQND